MGRSTGFRDIDSLLGGLRSGQLWSILGEPSVGRSALAALWAGQRARHEAVGLLSLRDAAAVVAARLFAAPTRVPLQAILAGQVRPEHRERLALERSTLSGKSIVFATNAEDLAAMLDQVEVIIVDDAELLGDDVHEYLPAIRDWCDSAGGAAILTAPISRATTYRGDQRELDPTWSGVCDVVMEVRRDDNSERVSARPGQADIVVLRHRLGPTDTVTVAFQGHYARFTDIPFNTDPLRPTGWYTESHHLTVTCMPGRRSQNY